MKRLIFLLLLTSFVFGSAPPGYAQAVPQSKTQITLSFAPLVKQVAPAVVNIYARRKIQQNVSPLFNDPFFRQFFGNALPGGLTRERLEASLGSGVMVRDDGLIVTSNHVIRGADQIRVVLSDRREFDATVVVSDEHSDLAVLRIEAKGESLPHLELGDSDDAQIGDLVLAIGNPFGVGQTVTSGIISAVAHTSVGASDLDYFIQTDAAINPGNSGGALVTMDGKLVGINAAIFSESGGNLGIGFAVPSNMVSVVLKAVIEGKKTIQRPWLGVFGQKVTPELALSMNMPQPAGLLVNSIHSASPATKSGLKVGDVITSINGKAVDDPETFHYRLATLPADSKITLGVMRKGQKLDVQTNLIAPPENPARDTTNVTGRNPLGGATIENLSPAVSEETGIRGIEQGVVISKIGDHAIASGVGLQAGDIILDINKVKTPAVSDVVAALKQHPDSWRMTIQRGDNVVTIVVGG